MDSRGECCIARYARGAYDMSKVDRIMLRYRPIAPKPTAGRSPVENLQLFVKAGKRKRRCVKRKNKYPGETVVTLPLLPESPDSKLSGQQEQNKDGETLIVRALDQHPRTTPYPKMIVTASVTVECVTDTWIDSSGLGCTDKERKMNLEKDTCPGFISDGWNRITWTNASFRKMVRDEEMVVWLVMNERVMVDGNLTAFSCRVRMELVGGGNERSSLTLPCDVWRLDGGGFAWRLDVTAALSLGRW